MEVIMEDFLKIKRNIADLPYMSDIDGLLKALTEFERLKLIQNLVARVTALTELTKETQAICKMYIDDTIKVDLIKERIKEVL